MMKNPTIRPRAALLIGAAFLATPAFAQDAPQSVTPPPILVAPAPAQPPAQRVIQIQPQSPVVQAVPEAPAAATAQPRAAQTRSVQTRTATARPTRAAAPTRAETAAPAASAAPAPAAAPVTEQPAPLATAPEAAAPPPVVETQPVPAPAPEATTTESSRTGSAWPWLLGGIALVIAGIAAFLLMRRRETDYVEESTYREPVAVDPVVAEPVAAKPVAEPLVVPVAAAAAAPVIEPKPELAGLPVAPVAEPEVRDAQAAVATAEDVSVHEPAKEDLAGVVDGTAPVARRPWIELGMRPVRAGTNKDDAVVDFELTVGNSGDVSAKDVRISTFMLADGASEGEIESMLTEHRDDPAVPAVTIEPGEGTRVDAHLAVPKGELGRTFNPVVVAEARYTLPDGRQGRTSAAFKVGCPSETGMRPLSASRPFVTETVEAELFGTPEHA